jgi:hypothetical protein
MTPELQALTQRLENIEKQVAHLEALAVERSDTDQTFAARTVNAQSFVVSDKNGVRRAELSMAIPAGQAEERPWLGLFDANGNVRACLGVEGGLPWLEFYDANQKSVVNIRVDQHGPRIGLYYGDGKPAAVITLSRSGPQIGLIGANGQECVRLSVSGDGPYLTLDGANGKPSVSVGVREGRRSLTLYGPSGNVEVNLEIAPSGAKELFMGEYSTEAQPTVGPSLKLGVTTDGPCLVFGKDNKVFWSAPQGLQTGQG